MRRANALRGKIVAALAAAGAPLLVGTDAGNPFVIPGESMHDELELLVAAGAPRARVLHAATAGAAAHLGLRGRAGVVAPGARADLLLVDADPLAGPLPLVPAGVVLRGRWLPRAELEERLAAIERSHAAPSSPRFESMPPLAAEGGVLFHAHYDLVHAGKVVGEERLVASRVPGGRALAAQIVGELPMPFELSYRIGPAGTSLAAKIGAGTVALDGRLEQGTLVVTGTSARGAPISTSAPFPPGAFLSGFGVAGSLELVERLAGMAVGERRSLASLELSIFPRPAAAAATHEVERKPDAGGLRVYAVTKQAGPLKLTGELTVDDAGQIAAQSLGPPLDLTFRRRP